MDFAIGLTLILVLGATLLFVYKSDPISRNKKTGRGEDFE